MRPLIGLRSRACFLMLLVGLCVSACRKERKDPFAEAELRQPPPPATLSGVPATPIPEPTTWEAKLALAQTATMTRDIPTAEKYWPIVLAEAEAFGISDPRYPTTINEAAYYYYFNNGMATAEQLFRKLVEVRKQLDGPEGIEVANELLKVANLCGFNSRVDEAEVFFKQALEITDKNPTHEKFKEIKKRVLTDHAATLQKVEGRQADAEALAAQAAAIQ